MRHAVVLALVGLVSCKVYNDSLVGGVGGGGQGGSSGTEPSTGSAITPPTSTGPGAGTAGGGNEGGGIDGVPCGVSDDCPGVDTECGHRLCVNGYCSMETAADGTVLPDQVPGDCLERRCNSQGDVVDAPADGDFQDDGKVCTSDRCDAGVLKHDPLDEGTTCSDAGGTVCNGAAVCVECLDDGDCASGVCGDDFACAPASCGDTVKNGSETATDCGGTCPGCAVGQACGAGTDCASGNCVDSTCAESCTDGAQNQDESDVDCGGICGDCGVGKHCGGPGDCASGRCTAGTCGCVGDHVVVSEVKSRGVAGGNDEYVELFNPTDAPVALDETWTLEARSHTAGGYGVRWTGAAGKAIPARGFFLIAGSAYQGGPAADGVLDPGITDATSLKLLQGGALVDALCYAFSDETASAFGSGYVCEGAAASNVPHNNDPAGNLDVALERLPGGGLGACTDTGSNGADFVPGIAANPQNSASPTIP